MLSAPSTDIIFLKNWDGRWTKGQASATHGGGLEGTPMAC
jgi:hypothetical protein